MATSMHLQNSSSLSHPYIELKNQHADALSSEIRFKKLSDSPAIGDNLGLIKFEGYNSAYTLIPYSQILGESNTTTSGLEEGKLSFKLYDGNITGDNEVETLSLLPNKVGIGTSNPQGQLHISSGNNGDCVLIIEADTDNDEESDNPRIEFRQDGGITPTAIYHDHNSLNISNSMNSQGGIIFRTGTTDNGWSTATERMRITSDGNIGLQYSNPDEKLVVNGTIRIPQNYSANGASEKLLFLSSPSGFSAGGINYVGGPSGNEQAGSYLNFFTSNNSKLVILQGGTVGIATTTPSTSYKLDVNGGIQCSSFNNTSDDRIKFNEITLNGPNSLSIINQLQPKKYEKISQIPESATGTWIPTDANWESVKNNYNWVVETGLLAQDIQSITDLAYTVTGNEVDDNDNQTVLGLKYNDIFSYHIAATKELSSQLDVEKAKTATLQTQVADLIARITSLESN